MTSFHSSLHAASRHTFEARGQLTGTTSHLFAFGGFFYAVDIDFHIASMLKSLARLAKESLDNPEVPAHAQEAITELMQLIGTAMHQQGDAARKLRELSDAYEHLISRRDFDEWLHLNGKSRK